MKLAQWLITAAACAAACQLAVHHATPIDRALPFMAVLIVFIAAFSHVAVVTAVPLLMVAEIAIAGEPLRLLVFGVIWSGAALVAALYRRGAPDAIVVAAILLLRWIPIDAVMVPRELLLLGFALAILWVLGRTPFAAAIAIFTALFTPAIPLRTFLLPFAVLLVATLARLFGMPRLKLALPSAIAIAFAVLFFAWSGLVARAFPYMLREPRAAGERYTVNAALGPGDSVMMGVPDGARAAIVSGANVPHLRRGALLGRIEPGGIDVRIGDAADWGSLRRDQFYGSRNPLPRDPAGKVRDYGYLAWIDGAGRVALPRGAKSIRVTASPSLPADAKLQFEAFELAPR